jgi:hypothetical protein
MRIAGRVDGFCEGNIFALVRRSLKSTEFISESEFTIVFQRQRKQTRIVKGTIPRVD